MPGYVLVCPFCLTIFMSGCDEGDICPACDVGELIDYEDYKLRLYTSFMDFISKERGLDEQ